MYRALNDLLRYKRVHQTRLKAKVVLHSRMYVYRVVRVVITAMIRQERNDIS